jgi:hypothetical protein
VKQWHMEARTPNERRKKTPRARARACHAQRCAATTNSCPSRREHQHLSPEVGPERGLNTASVTLTSCASLACCKVPATIDPHRSNKDVQCIRVYVCHLTCDCCSRQRSDAPCSPSAAHSRSCNGVDAPSSAAPTLHPTVHAQLFATVPTSRSSLSCWATLRATLVTGTTRLNGLARKLAGGGATKATLCSMGNHSMGTGL